jgi:hypothetical protein
MPPGADVRSDVEQADDSYGASTWRAYALMVAERLRAAELELVDLRSGAPTRSTTPRPPRSSASPDIDLRDPTSEPDEGGDPDAERFGPGPDAEFWSDPGRGSGTKTGLRARFGRQSKGEEQPSGSVVSDDAPDT